MRGTLAGLFVVLVWPMRPVCAAESYTATGVSEEAVQSAVDRCVADDECTTVHIPEGVGQPEAWMDEVSWSGKGISIIGAGVGKTVINLHPSNRGEGGLGAAFYCANANGEYVRVSGMSIYSVDRAAGKSSSIAIKHTHFAGFRIDNIHVQGDYTTGGAISVKFCWKGLVDHVTFVDDDPESNLPYGLTSGGPSINKPDCQVYTKECIDQWDAKWWDYSHYGQTFDEDYVPGTDNAIFVEDCTFEYLRSAVMWNWDNKTALVVRHNDFHVDDRGAQSPICSTKPGTIWFDVYDNHFYYEGEKPYGSNVHTVRSSGTIHHNHYHKIVRPGRPTCHSGYGNGSVWTPQTQIDELYIWGNTFDNTKYANDAICDDDVACGWMWTNSYNHGDVTCKAFTREPAISAGDRFDYSTYTYPHDQNDGQPGDPVASSDGGMADSATADSGVSDAHGQDTDRSVGSSDQGGETATNSINGGCSYTATSRWPHPWTLASLVFLIGTVMRRREFVPGK